MEEGRSSKDMTENSKSYLTILIVLATLAFAMWALYETTTLAPVPYSKIYERREATQSSRSQEVK